jgi:hypothetical protein
MTTPKKYIVTESQMKALMEKKKHEKGILIALINEIKAKDGVLNETSGKSSVTSILKKHIPVGPISKSLTEALIASKLVTMDHLKEAKLVSGS